jgi:hypothetical protein
VIGEMVLARPAPVVQHTVEMGARKVMVTRNVLVLVAAVASSLAVGCGDRTAAAPAPLDAAACTALGDDGTSAEWIADGAAQALGKPLPAHCLLRGVLEPRIGDRGVAYGIGFELRLPAAWNGRFFFQGGSGSDGFVATAFGVTGGRSALGLGFAVVTTDSGHEGSDQEFGFDPQARVDYGYRALDVVTKHAKGVIADAYGRAPDRSYLVGCSNGGRQGFIATQRFADQYDGVLAGAPAFDVARASVAAAWNTQAVAAIATISDATGHPYLPATFSDADLDLLEAGILARCDANDGLADGIVDDLPDCDFDPGLLACAGAKTASCLDAAQVGALRKIFGGARSSRGEALYSDFFYDGGVGDPSPIGSLRGWSLGSTRVPVNNSSNVTLVAGLLSRVFMTPPRDDVDLVGFMLDFDFDRDAPQIFATSGAYAESGSELVSATSTDLSAFRERGGKLIAYHGASDGVFSVKRTMRWFEDLDASSDGGAAGFARLFVVPGMGHCAGGPATDGFDAFSALVDWVENDVAPDRLVATASAASPFPGRTRPLCPYPRQTRYRGTGDIETAASFDCR